MDSTVRAHGDDRVGGRLSARYHRRMLRIALSGGALALVFSVGPRVAGEQATPETIAGEAIYPRPSLEVWGHATGLLRDWKFSFEKEDKKHQVIVTRWRGYDETIFPKPVALGLRPDDRVKKIQLHVMVSSLHEPARVAVGSLLEVERVEEGSWKPVLAYRMPALEEWLLGALDDRVGAQHEALAATVEARTKQAARLGVAPTCSGVANVAGEKPVQPSKTSDVQPIFPAEGLRSVQRKVVLMGTLTEHGTLSNLTVSNPSTEFAYYEGSARAAVSLWRFRPATQAGCPIAIPSSVSVNYTLR